jgi:hypothetical protein
MEITLLLLQILQLKYLIIVLNFIQNSAIAKYSITDKHGIISII